MSAIETILLVEDEAAMRRFLRAAFASHGFRVVEAETVAAGEVIARESPPAAIVLDLGLPDGDGVELLRRLRAWSSMPVIVLSARDREGDKVEALDSGADDYVTKPFGTNELLARTRVAIRHAQGRQLPEERILGIGPIRIDPDRHEVSVDGQPVHLTPIEFRLLAMLARHPGRVLTHHQLLTQVWGPTAVQNTHYLRVHMAALRRKIELDPSRPRWLATEASVGYRIRDA